jgi:hypothetical protein
MDDLFVAAWMIEACECHTFATYHVRCNPCCDAAVPALPEGLVQRIPALLASLRGCRVCPGTDLISMCCQGWQDAGDGVPQPALGAHMRLGAAAAA